jgi:D-xylose transport system substrate-binding protein
MVRRVRVAAAAAIILGLTAAGCGGDDGGGGGGGGGGGKIALLLPESKTTRYEAQDRPLFEAKVEDLCPDCEIVYSNAEQDSAKQLSQVEAAIAKQVDVMVLDPVDSAAAANMVTKAKSADIPVISYDRLITDSDVDYYISFDNEEVGKRSSTSSRRTARKTARSS